MNAQEQEQELNKVLDDFDKNSVPPTKKVNPFLAYMRNNAWTFGFVIAFGIGASYAMNYDKDHPVTCDSQGTVKELISIEGHYAKIKLQDERVVKYQISRSSKSGSSYGPGIKPNDVICLGYSRK